MDELPQTDAEEEVVVTTSLQKECRDAESQTDMTLSSLNAAIAALNQRTAALAQVEAQLLQALAVARAARGPPP